jgi:hypothetical protein
MEYAYSENDSRPRALEFTIHGAGAPRLSRDTMNRELQRSHLDGACCLCYHPSMNDEVSEALDAVA